MPKHIGIIAVSSEGAALCYRTIILEAFKTLGGLNHPEITMHSHSLQQYEECTKRGDWNGVASLMLSSAQKLATAGADFAICPDNTVHRAFDKVAHRSPIPLLSIIDLVAHACQARSYRKVGVLGTTSTMNGPIYRDALSQLDIEMVVPGEAEQRRVHSLIFEHLVRGRADQSIAESFVHVIQGLKERGCEAVILGCTEIPLVVTPGNSSLPIVDSTRLLAQKALEHALQL